MDKVLYKFYYDYQKKRVELEQFLKQFKDKIDFDIRLYLIQIIEKMRYNEVDFLVNDKKSIQ